MTCNIFTALDNLMGSGESFRLDICRISEGLQVIVTPKLKSLDDALLEELTDDQKQIRASLSIPLCFNGKPEDIDSEFFNVLNTVSDIRKPVVANMAEIIGCLNEANKEVNTGKSRTRISKTPHVPPPKAASNVSDNGAPEDNTTASTNVSSPKDQSMNPDSIF